MSSLLKKTQVRRYHANSSHSWSDQSPHVSATPPRRSNFAPWYYFVVSLQSQAHYCWYYCYCFLDQYLHQADDHDHQYHHHHDDLIAILLLLLPPRHDWWLNVDLRVNDHHNSPIFAANSHQILHYASTPPSHLHNPNPNHYHYSLHRHHHRHRHCHPYVLAHADHNDSNSPGYYCYYYYYFNSHLLLITTSTTTAPTSNTLSPITPWIASLACSSSSRWH